MGLMQLLRGVALHKPAGYVCSRARDVPEARLVHDLLPAEWARRRPGLEVCGRLDKEATGLVLLSQDGQLAAAAIARGHARVYEVETEKDIAAETEALFAAGTLRLRGEATPLLPARLERLGPRRARVEVREGRYHQVRRMFEATDNRLTAIARVAVAGVALGDLGPGQYRLLTEEELASLSRPRPRT